VIRDRARGLVPALLIAAGVISLWRMGGPLIARPPDNPAMRVEEAVAHRLGQAAAACTKDRNAVLLLLPAVDAEDAQRNRRLEKAFTRGLGSSASEVVRAGPERLPPTERGELAMRVLAGTWRADFEAWTRTPENVGVIVSMLPLPPDLDPAGAPVLGCWDGTEDSARKALRNPRIKALAVPRPPTPRQHEYDDGDDPERIFNERQTLLEKP
jgi:hypothetical protein